MKVKPDRPMYVPFCCLVKVAKFYFIFLWPRSSILYFLIGRIYTIKRFLWKIIHWQFFFDKIWQTI